MAEEPVKLLASALRRRRIITERTKKRLSRIEWKLGEHFGSSDFFDIHHKKTVVIPEGGVQITLEVRDPQRMLEYLERRINEDKILGEDVEATAGSNLITIDGEDLVHIIHGHKDVNILILSRGSMKRAKRILEMLKKIAEAVKEHHEITIAERGTI